MFELLCLLLPLAAASGWYAALHSRQAAGHQPGPALCSRYFKGISYLLNEEPDKAIEAFIKALEVDSETIETHLALGNFYRRQGEVERAIRIHQNLSGCSNLTPEHRNEALLELAQDYMGAGLLDRAEAIFQELVDREVHKDHALRKLMEIYEREKDWNKAIHSAQTLARSAGEELGPVIAHYTCEEAEQIQQEGEEDKALTLLRSTLKVHPQCVRASLLEGDILAGQGDYRAAVQAYLRVERQDPDYLTETVGRMERCFGALGDFNSLIDYLFHVQERYNNSAAMLALVEYLLQTRGEGEAIDFMTTQLRLRPSISGCDRLLGLKLLRADPGEQDHLILFKDLTSRLLQEREFFYRCCHCGFLARTLHWHCPSCKRWNSVKPIQGVEGS
jgi:lipopolysaccharide biosynthesis regulator YciM